MMNLWIKFFFEAYAQFLVGVHMRLLGICIEYRLVSENISGCTPDVKRGKIVNCETAPTCILVMDCMQTAHSRCETW